MISDATSICWLFVFFIDVAGVRFPILYLWLFLVLSHLEALFHQPLCSEFDILPVGYFSTVHWCFVLCFFPLDSHSFLVSFSARMMHSEVENTQFFLDSFLFVVLSMRVAPEVGFLDDCVYPLVPFFLLFHLYHTCVDWAYSIEIL